MLIILYVIITIIGIIILLGLIAPKKYYVSRSIIIGKPKEEVFKYIKYIKNQDEWSPWKKKDSNMNQSYEGTDGEVGFISKWEGNKEVGTGEQEIKRVVENQTIESELRFFKPWKSKSDAFITVTSYNDNSTRVNWGFSAVNKPPSNIFFFFNMDKTVGKDFEVGLHDLQVILESK